MRDNYGRMNDRFCGAEFEMKDFRKLKLEKSPNKGVSDKDWNKFRSIQKLTFDDQERNMPTLERTVNFLEEKLDKKGGLRKALLLLGDFAVEDERGEEVQAWAVHEVVGYRRAEDLPAYRQVSVESLQRGSKALNVPVEYVWLELGKLPVEARKLVGTTAVFESIDDLVKLLDTMRRRCEGHSYEDATGDITFAQMCCTYINVARQVAICSEMMNIFESVRERATDELDKVMRRELYRDLLA